MTTSSYKKGLRKHLEQIFAKWEGIDMILKKKTFDLDGNGKIIGHSYVSSTVKGVISSVPIEMEKDAAGKLEDRQIRGVFLHTGDNTTMPVYEDHIIDSSDMVTKEYVVIAIPYIDMDIDDPTLITCELREVPYEG